MHSYYGQNPLLREMEINEPCVRINPADAEVRGIEDGSYVRLFNDRGQCGSQGHLQRRHLARAAWTSTAAGSAPSTRAAATTT
ncbi:MAG: molybdopterin dinucleotide binding domain-containing protein [Adlercreutzia equolifaciens]